MNINNFKLYGSIIWCTIILATSIYLAIIHLTSNSLLQLLSNILLLISFNYIQFYIKLLKKKHKNYAANLMIMINLIIMLSYYLTRLKIINGPFNYSLYLDKPIIKFDSI